MEGFCFVVAAFEKYGHYLYRKEEVEREAARLRAELDDAKGDLAKSDESRKALRTEIR